MVLFLKKATVITLIVVFSLSFPGASVIAAELADTSHGASTEVTQNEKDKQDSSETRELKEESPKESTEKSAEEPDDSDSSEQLTTGDAIDDESKEAEQSSEQHSNTESDADELLADGSEENGEESLGRDAEEGNEEDPKENLPTEESAEDGTEQGTDEVTGDTLDDQDRSNDEHNQEDLDSQETNQEELTEEELIKEESAQKELTQTFSPNSDTSSDDESANHDDDSSEETENADAELNNIKSNQERLQAQAQKDAQTLAGQDAMLTKEASAQTLQERLAPFIAKELELPTEEVYDPGIVTEGLKDFSGIVRQSTPYTCGAAALATLLSQSGIPTTEGDILVHAPADKERGVSLYALKQASIARGQHTYLKKWTLAQLKQYIADTQQPVLVHDIKPGVGGHYGVVRKFTNKDGKETVTFSDTEAGNIEYSVEDFAKIYTGNVLVIDGEIEAVGEVSDVSSQATTDTASENTTNDDTINTQESALNTDTAVATENETPSDTADEVQGLADTQVTTTKEIHPLLSDTNTDISDEEAKNIWGKYVPVYFTMEQMGGEEARIALKLKACKERAPQDTQSVTQNAAARERHISACYDQFIKDIKDADINATAITAAWAAANAVESTVPLLDTQSRLIEKSAFIKELRALEKEYRDKQRQYGPIYSYYSDYYTRLAERYRADVQTLSNHLNNLKNSSYTYQGRQITLGSLQGLIKAKTAQLREVNQKIAAQYDSNNHLRKLSHARIDSYQREINRYNNQKKELQNTINDYKNGRLNPLNSSDNRKIRDYKNNINSYQDKIRDYKKKSKVNNPYYTKKAEEFKSQAKYFKKQARKYDKKADKQNRKANRYRSNAYRYQHDANRYKSSYKYWYKKYKKYKKKYKKKRKWKYRWRYYRYYSYAKYYKRVYRYYNKKASRSWDKYYSSRNRANRYYSYARSYRSSERRYKRLEKRYYSYAKKYKVNSNRYKYQIRYYQKRITSTENKIKKVKHNAIKRAVGRLNDQIAHIDSNIRIYNAKIASERRSLQQALAAKAAELNDQKAKIRNELLALQRELAKNNDAQIARAKEALRRVQEKADWFQQRASVNAENINYYGNHADTIAAAITREYALIKAQDKLARQAVTTEAKEEVKQYITLKAHNISVTVNGVTRSVRTVAISSKEAVVNFANGAQKTLQACSVTSASISVGSAITGVGISVAAGSEVLGAFCDLSDGAIYFIRGDIKNGAISTFSAIPVIGLAGTSVRVAKLTDKERRAVEAAQKGSAKTLKVFSVSLAKQEGIDGAHVISKHVGKDAKYLQKRLREEKNIKRATTFTNLGTAQTAINKALKEKSKEIAEWLEDKKKSNILRFVAKADDSIGFGYEEVDGELRKLNNLSKFRIVLKKSDKTDNGFIILTAYLLE